MGSWTDEEIEALARRFRQKIGIDDLIWIDAPTLIFKVCHHFPEIDYQLVDDADLPPPGGRWDADRKLLIYRRSVFEAANKPNPDPPARWTVTHEITHAVFDDQGIRNRSTRDSNEKRFSSTIRRIESRTDRFTGAVLAPLHLIEQNESVESISQRFGLSKTAATIRKGEAERAYRKQHGILRPLPASIQTLLDEIKKN
jgi:hypothetical protein